MYRTGQIFDGPAYSVDWLKSQGILKANSTHIKNCCMGIRKSAYGYQWEY